MCACIGICKQCMRITVICSKLEEGTHVNPNKNLLLNNDAKRSYFIKWNTRPSVCLLSVWMSVLSYTKIDWDFDEIWKAHYFQKYMYPSRLEHFTLSVSQSIRTPFYMGKSES